MARYGQTTFFEHTPDSPDEQYSLNSARIIRELDIPAATFGKRIQAVADILGSQQLVNANILNTPDNNAPSPRFITRSLPLSYAWLPTSAKTPNAAYLFASNILRGKTVGRPSGTTLNTDPAGAQLVGANVDWYRFTVEFTTRTYNILSDNQIEAVAPTMVPSGFNGQQLFGNRDFGPAMVPAQGSFPPSPVVGSPDEGQKLAGKAFMQHPQWPPVNGLPKFSTGTRYITRYYRPSSRFRVFPYGLATWGLDAKQPSPIREGVPVNESMAEVTYVWHLVPEAAVPFGAIQNCLNGINIFWFDGFAPNTLCFLSAEVNRYIGPLGDVLYDLQYKFQWLPKYSFGLFNPTGNNPPNSVPRPGPAAFVNNLPAQAPGFPCGWNFQLRSKAVNNGQPPQLDYDQVSGAITASPSTCQPFIFPPRDFTTLFRPDQQ